MKTSAYGVADERAANMWPVVLNLWRTEFIAQLAEKLVPIASAEPYFLAAFEYQQRIATHQGCDLGKMPDINGARAVNAHEF